MLLIAQYVARTWADMQSLNTRGPLGGHCVCKDILGHWFDVQWDSVERGIAGNGTLSSLVFYWGMMPLPVGSPMKGAWFPARTAGAMLGYRLVCSWGSPFGLFSVWYLLRPLLVTSLGHQKLAGRACNDVWFVYRSLSVDLPVEVCSRAAATAVSRHNNTTLHYSLHYSQHYSLRCSLHYSKHYTTQNTLHYSKHTTLITTLLTTTHYTAHYTTHHTTQYTTQYTTLLATLLTTHYSLPTTLLNTLHYTTLHYSLLTTHY